MENGANKVEEVRSKVGEFDTEVLGDVVNGNGNGTDDAFEETNGGEESVLKTVEVEESVDDRKDISNENGGNLDVVESQKLEDSVKAHTDPVEEVISMEVIETESTSGNTTSDQSVVVENNELVDSDEHKEKVLNLAENGPENTSSDQLSGLEVNEIVNDDNGEEKVLNLVQEIDAESSSDIVASNQASELETNVSVVGEPEIVGVTNEQNTNDPNVLENNEVIENRVNEDNDGQPVILEDVLENSENGVSEFVDLDEKVDHVNGNSVNHKEQVDGEIGVVVNDKDLLGTESKDDLINVQNELKDDKNLEKGSTSAVDQSQTKDIEMLQDAPVKKEPELKPIIGVSLPTQKPATTQIPVANPKPDSNPNQSPIPNSKPATAPTPAPSPAPARPAGLPVLEPAHRVVPSQPNGTTSPPQNQVIDEPTNGEPEENDETREKLQMIRVKFLRLARRLGQTTHNVVVAQVLYRLGLAEQLRGRNGGRVAAFSFERASDMAEQLEATGQEPLEFSCTIMVLGKTGVGKSATINSIFDEIKFGTDAFQLGTKKVQDVVGTVQGIKVRVIDTPGLLPSWADQRKNEKILHSVKKFIQKSPPDIVLYLDRLDMQSRDFGDMPLLRTITDIFGQSIWFNAIVVLTHAASAPPEGPNGVATGYDMFVTQRSHVVQQAIRQAAGDMRLMNPVSLVENHSACRTNRAGQRVLPNGQVWKPHLLLLSFASKILVEANMLLKLQDSPPGKTSAPRTRAPPLPFILSNLLQSRPQLQLPQEQFGDDFEGDDDDDLSDDESSEYDELPPFKRLTNSQLSKLSKAQRKAYHDELEYREKLFMKKQLKEEKKRRKMMKKMAEEAKNFPTELTDNNVEEDSNGSATVPVAVQDMNLPASFDADNPTHRYRALDSANQWLIRPVLDPHGWDHDVGYEGINVEHLLALQQKIPVSFSGQITKDKKDANLQMEVSSAVKHGKTKSTTAAFDMQTVGKEMSYTLRSETRFINHRRNKASAGFSATYFGDTLTGGFKFEDKLMVNKRGQLVMAGGAVIGRGDVAYGGSLEATLRDKDHPLGRFLSTVGLSVMDWHGDLAIGWNAQSQIPIGRFSNLIGRFNLNNKGAGQVSVRLNSSEQLQIALVALIPLLSKAFGYYQDRDSAY